MPDPGQKNNDLAKELMNMSPDALTHLVKTSAMQCVSHLVWQQVEVLLAILHHAPHAEGS
jgi:hypothetical protein